MVIHDSSWGMTMTRIILTEGGGGERRETDDGFLYCRYARAAAVHHRQGW